MWGNTGGLAREIVSTVIVASLAMIALGGCAGGLARGSSAAAGDGEARVVGIWIERPDFVDPAMGRPIGLFMHFAGPPSAERLADGSITGSFRSAREAWVAAAERGDVEWYRGRVDRGWTFERVDPPRVDGINGDNEQPALLDGWPVVRTDELNLDRFDVEFLPPPLEGRGVAIFRALSGKANPIYAMYPADVSTVMTTSWQQVDETLTRGRVEAVWTHGPWWCIRAASVDEVRGRSVHH